MIEIVRYTQRNVKRWQDGDMRKRWTAAGMLVAEQQFRRIIGYRDLAKLVIAVERHAILAAATQPRPPGDRRARYRLTVNPGDRRRSSTTIRTTSSTIARTWMPRTATRPRRLGRRVGSAARRPGTNWVPNCRQLSATENN